MVSSNARTKEASQAKYISILNIIQGEVDPTQVLIAYLLNLVLESFYPTNYQAILSIFNEFTACLLPCRRT